jgi:hypothetical protein
MQIFEIVALNPENGEFNVLETGFTSYDDADEQYDDWCNRYPNAWIEVITYDERVATCGDNFTGCATC